MSYNPLNPNGSATSANSAPVVFASDQAAFPPLTFMPGSVAAVNGDLIAAIDVTGYKWLSISIQGTFSATYSFQGSNDNFATTAFPLVMTQVTTGVPGQVTSSGSSAITWQGGIPFRYLRVRVTSYTSGTVTSTAQAYALSPPPSQFININSLPGVSQSGTWTVQPGNTANTTPWLVDQKTTTVGTITSIAGATSSTTILASNVNRNGASIYNDSTAILYLGTTASAVSTTSYSVQIAAGGYYELPNTRLYTGQLTGIWSAANGSARVTELT